MTAVPGGNFEASPGAMKSSSSPSSMRIKKGTVFRGSPFESTKLHLGDCSLALEMEFHGSRSVFIFVDRNRKTARLQDRVICRLSPLIDDVGDDDFLGFGHATQDGFAFELREFRSRQGGMFEVYPHAASIEVAKIAVWVLVAR